ncbi:hypothetical protein [Geodermatophilus sp. SYSU D01036]
MIRVCFAGVTGWTAPPILAAVDAAEDLTLTAGVSRSAAGRALSEATASRSEGRVFGSVAGTLLAIRRVAEAPGVRRGLDTLLFDRP